MLKEGIKEEEIIVGKVNILTVVDDNKYVYFPDIFLDSENKLIEVNSEWSMKFPTNIQEKAEASLAE